MKKLREFTNTKDDYVDNISTAIYRIRRLPLPYTGNKKKLLYLIHDALKRYNVEFDSVLDAFTGSASVALLFKLMGKKVLANDLLTSSYLNAVAFVENPGIKLTDEEKDFLLNHENIHKSTFVEDNYLGIQFRKNKECRFNKFTLKECQQLDNFRANIDELCGIHAQSLSLAANAAVVMRLPFGSVDASTDILSHRKKQQDNYGKTSDVRTGQKDRRIGIYYDKDFNLRFDKWFRKYIEDFTQGIKSDILEDVFSGKIKRAAFLANLQQHVLRDCMVQGRMHKGQALAELKVRVNHPKNQLKGTWSNSGATEMDFHTKAGTSDTAGEPGQGFKWWNFADIDMPGKCFATNMDTTALLKSNFCKVDAVYFDPPYGGGSSDYATMYRFLEEYIYSEPLENLPHITNARKFVSKTGYEDNFMEMLEAAQRIPIWIFSYNDASWKSIDYITDIIKQYRENIICEVLTSEYRYLYRQKQGRERKASEYLIIAR